MCPDGNYATVRLTDKSNFENSLLSILINMPLLIFLFAKLWNVIVQFTVQIHMLHLDKQKKKSSAWKNLPVKLIW